MIDAERLARHTTVSTHLALRSDRQLAALADEAEPVGTGIGGTTARLDIDGVPVFVKKVPLTDLERRPEHVRSTVNLFGLPTFYQYGIGSAGFGAWRELAVHLMTTNWVLDDACGGFPLLYHWRVLPRPPATPTPAQTAELERWVGYWEGSPAVRERLVALTAASASLVLFMEHFPRTVHQWLTERAAVGEAAAAAAYAMVERELRAGTTFMDSRGLLHFDAHFLNLLTDGRRLYFADFGLALSSRFDLSAPETAFLRTHRGYDRHYAMAHFARWLVSTTLSGSPWKDRDEIQRILRRAAHGDGCGDLPPAAADIVTRHAPLAVRFGEFAHDLQTVSKSTPYPVEEIRHLGR